MKAIGVVALLAVFGLLIGVAQAQVVVLEVEPYPNDEEQAVTFTVQNQGDRKINFRPSFGALGAQGTCPDPEDPYDPFCNDTQLDLNTVWTNIEPSMVKGLGPEEYATFTVRITDDDRKGYALVTFNAGGSLGMAEIDYEGDGGPFIPHDARDHTIQVQAVYPTPDEQSLVFEIVNISDKVQGVSTSVSCRDDELGDGIDAREIQKSKEVWSDPLDIDKRGRLYPGGVQYVKITPDTTEGDGPYWIILRAGSGAGELHSYGYAVLP